MSDERTGDKPLPLGHRFAPCNTTAEWPDKSPRCLLFNRGEEWRCHNSEGSPEKCGQPRSAHEPHVEPKRDEYGLTEAERLAGKTPCGCLYWPGCACPDPLDRKRPEPCCEEHGLRELVTELGAQPSAPAWLGDPKSAGAEPDVAAPEPQDRLRKVAEELSLKLEEVWTESPEAEVREIHAALVRVVRETAEHGCKAVNEQRRALRHWGLEEKP